MDDDADEEIEEGREEISLAHRVQGHLLPRRVCNVYKLVKLQRSTSSTIHTVRLLVYIAICLSSWFDRGVGLGVYFLCVVMNAFL